MTSGKIETKITRDDLEGKLRGLKNDASATAQAATSKLFLGAAGSALATVAGVFLLGKRKGRKKNTVVEVRRL